jgi:hypothetical protein
VEVLLVAAWSSHVGGGQWREVRKGLGREDKVMRI